MALLFGRAEVRPSEDPPAKASSKLKQNRHAGKARTHGCYLAIASHMNHMNQTSGVPLTDVELGGSLEPPRDLYVEVRVLKDAGEIQTEYGYGQHVWMG